MPLFSLHGLYNSSTFLIQNFKLPAVFCDGTNPFVSDLFENHNWFSHDFAHFVLGGTGPSSDNGWGCMLRCGQMMLAQALVMRHLGRSKIEMILVLQAHKHYEKAWYTFQFHCTSFVLKQCGKDKWS